MSSEARIEKIVMKKFKCVPKNMPQGNDDSKGATMDLRQLITADSYKIIGNKVVFYDGPLRERENADGEIVMMKLGENIVAKLDNPSNWDITVI